MHASQVQSLANAAQDCFAHGAYWEAHEHLEAIWRALPPGPACDATQGVIQIAAAYHKPRQSRRVAAGMRRILDRAWVNFFGVERGEAGATPGLPALEPWFRASWREADMYVERWLVDDALADVNDQHPVSPPLEITAATRARWCELVACER